MGQTCPFEGVYTHKSKGYTYVCGGAATGYPQPYFVAGMPLQPIASTRQRSEF
jgi:hypothetical protein